MSHTINCASHLTVMLTPRRAKFTVRQVIKMIKARGLEFDTIACRGVSGLLIAPIVAMRLNKSLLVVRKGEDTHSPYHVEGNYGAKRYLILDDFIDNGGTVRDIINGIFDASRKARCVGFIAYKRLSLEQSMQPFEHQMERAWWDHESDVAEKFFPSAYNHAVATGEKHEQPQA
jgi:adenine/guanine phosphoribosyltransferase-like PRPP-binding protein